MKHPRLPSHLNKARKLTDKDILRIKTVSKVYLREGKTKTWIAKKLKVPRDSLYYWGMSPQQRLERNKKRYASSGIKQNLPEYREKKRAKSNLSHKRKRELQPKYEKYMKAIRSRSSKKSVDKGVN